MPRAKVTSARGDAQPSDGQGLDRRDGKLGKHGDGDGRGDAVEDSRFRDPRFAEGTHCDLSIAGTSGQGREVP
jgi:hypothetical protein